MAIRIAIGISMSITTTIITSHHLQTITTTILTIITMILLTTPTTTVIIPHHPHNITIPPSLSTTILITPYHPKISLQHPHYHHHVLITTTTIIMPHHPYNFTTTIPKIQPPPSLPLTVRRKSNSRHCSGMRMNLHDHFNSSQIKQAHSTIIITSDTMRWPQWFLSWFLMRVDCSQDLTIAH